jgi:iron complex outermembrane receptor protein
MPISSRRLAGAAIACLAAGAGTIAMGQTPTLPPVVVPGIGFDRLQAEETAETASRLGLKLKETPASVDVVYQRELQDRGARTVVQALQGVTGLIGAVRAGAPGVYSMRGFIENGISVQYDGIRVGATTVYTRPYDAFNFERIEVLRGPASAIHGDSAVGGAINYIRRKPAGGPVTVEAIASGASYSTYRLGASMSGSAGATTSFLLSAVGSQGKSFVDRKSSNDAHLLGGLAFDLGGGMRLLIEADYWRASTDNAYWGTPLVAGSLERGLRKVNYNVAPDNEYYDAALWTRAALDYRLGGAWTARTQLYYYSADRSWKNFAAPRANAGTNPLTVTIREVEDLIYDAKQPGLRHEMNNRGTLGTLPYRLAVGLDLNRSDFESPRFQAGPTTINEDAFNPGERNFGAFAGPRNRLRAAEVDTQALFLEGALDLTSALRLIGGYRHDRLKVRTWFQQPGAAIQDGANDYSSNNYRLGLTYALAPHTTLYGAVATGAPGRTFELSLRTRFR